MKCMKGELSELWKKSERGKCEKYKELIEWKERVAYS